jgi:hypothetical protein
LFADFGLNGNQRYYISTGIQVSSLGGKYEYRSVELVNDNLYSATTSVQSTVRYLEVPLAIKMRTNELGYSIIGGYAGFGTGFRLGAHQERETTPDNGAIEPITKGKENVDETYHPMRLSFIVGLELERKITKDTYFTFGLSFNNGLTNVFSERSYETDENGNIDYVYVNGEGKPQGEKLKATNKSISLHFGIYF